MRKLILLVLLLCSTTAYAEMSDAQKLAQYGKLRLSHGSAVGFPIPLPPPQYARLYTGLLSVVKMDDYSVLRSLCNSATAVACSVRSSTSCLVMLGPIVHDSEAALAHEEAHCQGWPAGHPGAVINQSSR